MEFASFPKNLAYNIKNLSGFSKTTVKLTPDRTGKIPHGESIKVWLPQNTIVDLRTFTLFYKGTAVSTGGGNVHFPRLSSSIIKTLAVYINGTFVERIDNYNTLYNKLYDLDGGGVDHTAKRFLENADPFIGFSVATNSNDTTAGTPVIKTRAATLSDTRQKFMVNNWLGFLSTCNCPCPDTNDLNNVEIEITFADEKVHFSGAHTTQGAEIDVVGARYDLEAVHFTILTSRQAAVNKGTSVNVLTTVNSTSLDQLICCFQPASTPISVLQLRGSNNINAGTSFNEVFAAAFVGQSTGTTLNGINAGDLYNQSVFFKSDATGITSCSIEINNTPLMPQSLEDDELYNETLIALGNLNQNMSSGIHPGCYSLAHLLKYYFTHIVSLENIQQGDFYKSGLDGKSSALNIAWKMTFGGTVSTTEFFIPIIFAKCTLIMVVND